MQRFQTGGTVNFHAIANTARAGEDADTTTTQASSKKQSLISDSLMKSLYTEGIPVDVDWLSGKIANLEHREAMGLGVSSSEVQAINAQINRVVQNAKYLEAAEKQAIKNDALADVAVDDKGYMYVMTEKGLDKKHFSKFNAEKEQALTVSDLINYRKNVPSLAFNNDYIQTISTSIGTTKIQEYITGILSSIGDSTSATDAYTNLATILGRDAKKLTEQEYKALASMAQVAQQVGLDAVLKESIKSKDSNMQAALGYLQRVLPRNMQYQLKAQYVAAGGDADDNNIGELLTYAGATYNKSSREYSVDYEKGMNDAAGTSGSDKQWTMTGLEQLIQGTLGQRQFNIVTKDHSGLAFTLNGNGLGKLMDSKNDLVNESILSDALNKGLGALIDQNGIYFGDQKISPHSLDKFVYDGADVINIWAPVDSTGAVDIDKLAKYEELRKAVKANPNLKPDDIRQMMAELGLNGTLDANGNFVGQDPNMAQFIVLTGLTSDEVMDIEENELAYKLQGNDKKESLEKIKQIYGMANKGLKGDSRREFPTGWWDWSTDIVAAPIFMRVGTTARFDVGTVVGHGAKVPQQSYQNLIAKDQARPITKPSSSIL